MTIRHMKIFIAVADYGKMSLAAQKLYISQPTISQAISEVENHYHVLLFERLNKKLYITENGKILLNYARHIVNLFEDMEITMQNSSKNILLNIGATITVATCLLNKTISRFEIINSDIKVNVFVDNTSIIEDKILRSQLDLAIVEGEIKSSDIISSDIIDDELVLVCGNNNPLNKVKNIDAKELEGLPFIVREYGSGTRELFENQIKKSNINVYNKWVCNNSEAIKNAVIENQGLSVISKMLVEREVREKELHIIKINDMQLTRKFHLIYHKNKFLSEQISNFINFIINNK